MAGAERARPTLCREPIHPARVRSIGADGFAFIPNRFLREGFLASLTPSEQRLYLVLVLAADRRGLSYYHYDKLCALLEVTLDEYIAARSGLVRKDLVAYDGTRFQVLSLPAVPAPRLDPEIDDQDDDADGELDDSPLSARDNEARRAILASLARPAR